MDELLKKFQEKLRELERKIEEFRQKVNGLLKKIPSWVPDWIVDKVTSGWNKLCETLNKSLEGYYLAADQCGEPWVLRPAADRWTDDVGSPVSGTAATIAAGALLSDDKWTGSAAEQYKQSLLLQKPAVEGIKTQFTDTLFSSLDKIANAINIFVAALIVALIAFIVAVVAAILGCASVIGIPAAIGAVIVAAIVGGGAYYAAYTNLTSVCHEQEGVMRGKVGENTAYPAPAGGSTGAWPKAVIEMPA